VFGRLLGEINVPNNDCKREVAFGEPVVSRWRRQWRRRMIATMLRKGSPNAALPVSLVVSQSVEAVGWVLTLLRLTDDERRPYGRR
jgi:hypothetical protein